MPLILHRILIVEDDVCIALDLEDIVRNARGQIAGMAMSASEALGLIESENITVAVLDVQLGDHDSMPVARQLTVAGIPFIFHTGNANTDPLSSEWPSVQIIKKPATAHAVLFGLTTATANCPKGVTAFRKIT